MPWKRARERVPSRRAPTVPPRRTRTAHHVSTAAIAPRPHSPPSSPAHAGLAPSGGSCDEAHATRLMRRGAHVMRVCSPSIHMSKSALHSARKMYGACRAVDSTWNSYPFAPTLTSVIEESGMDLRSPDTSSSPPR